MKDFFALLSTFCVRIFRFVGCYVGIEREVLIGLRLDFWSWSECLFGRGSFIRLSVGT